MRGTAAALALVLASAPAWAAPQWRVDAESSRLGFQATQMGGAFAGAFRRFDADIRFDPDDLASSQVVVTVHMDSVDTQMADRDAQIRGPGFFDVARYPTARFTTTGFETAGDGRYVARAELTIRDVTRPVALPFTLAIDGATATVTGQLSLGRLDYGVGQGEWRDTKTVGEGVTVTVDLRATRVP